MATAAEAMKGSEIEQGLLGDCYLLCALATAVKDLQVVDDLIGAFVIRVLRPARAAPPLFQQPPLTLNRFCATFR